MVAIFRIVGVTAAIVTLFQLVQAPGRFTRGDFYVTIFLLLFSLATAAVCFIVAHLIAQSRREERERLLNVAVWPVRLSGVSWRPGLQQLRSREASRSLRSSEHPAVVLLSTRFP